MPELSRFYGIIIKMFFADHNPPHFHAEYGDHSAVIDIRTLGTIGGSLPPRALSMVVEWASMHKRELFAAWKAAAANAPPGKISPLP